MFDLCGYIASASSAPASRNSRISVCAHMKNPSDFTATAAARIGEPDYGRHINAIALSGSSHAMRR